MTDKNITFILGAIDRGASRAADKVHGSFSRLESAANRGKRGVKALGGALVTLGKIGVIALLAGIAALTTGLTGAVKAAAEEEKGIARLNAALKANVKGWNGSTATIEKAILQRQRLAFTDDDLRQSLGTLITAVGSQRKALDLQNTAMDVARLKSIGLDDASKLLIKAMGGNLRALKELGIVLPKNATKTQILAAIQKKAAGQAEAYGKTTAGAFESFRVAVGNLVEEVGARFLPIATNIAIFLNEKVIPAVSGAIATVSKWVDENRPLINQLTGFAGTVLAALGQAVSVVAGVIGTVISKVSKWVAENKPLITTVTTFAGKVLGALATALGNVVRFVVMVIDRLVSFFDSITANKQVMDGLRTVVGLIATAFGKVTEAVGFVLGKVGGFIDWITKNKDIVNGLKTAVALIAGAFNKVKDAIGFVLTKLGELGRWIAVNGPKLRDLVNLLRLLPGGGLSSNILNAGIGGRQHGGFVPPGSSVRVGEVAQETLHMLPQGGGFVVPALQGGRGTGGGVTVIVNYSPMMSTASPNEARQFVRGIVPELRRELARQGF